ncbi:putative zinc-finger-containing protein [Mycena amicta]|nr:putative zinc-finger-containing protein [Mycena amicta]
MPFLNQECYCAICDSYFHSLEQRAAHIQESTTHPECNHCKRRFLNNNTLRNHYIYSPYHHYCASCEIEFTSSAGLRYHIEHAPVHCDDSDDEEHELSHEWEEEMGQLAYPEEPAQLQDEELDNSWEEFDDYDYEDAEELKHLDAASQVEEDDDDDGDIVQFACPICRKTSDSVCCTPCGHIFCSPCVALALKDTHACPVCSQPSSVNQLRKIFIA